MADSLAERVQLQRAEEQTQGIPPETGRDTWQIGRAREAFRYGSRARAYKRRRCLAGDCRGRVRGGSYCAHHQYLVDAGVPVDADLARLTRAERRRVERLNGPRFGGRLRFG